MRTTSLLKSVDTEFIGDVTSTEVTFAKSPKLFRLMIDKLYTNPVEACVREAIQNANDSHLKAGKPTKPVKIKFPTQMDPHFSVRDYGTGMTDEVIHKIYTVMGASTKDTNDDESGGFGIGAWTPLAYTDASFLRCFDGKEVRNYTLTYLSNGSPAAVLNSRSPSDEPKGVEVIIPVKQQDITTFTKAIRLYAMGLDTEPRVTGIREYSQFGNLQIEQQGKGWKQFKYTGSYGDRDTPLTRPYARVGCVVYPINLSNLNLDPSVKRALEQQPFLIDFKVGDVNISASRDSLLYDEETIKVLTEKFEAIMHEQMKEYQDSIDKCATLWDAKCKRMDIENNISNYHLRNVYKSVKFTWKGQPVGKFADIVDPQKKPDAPSEFQVMHALRSQINIDAVRISFKSGEFTHSMSKKYLVVIDELDDPVKYKSERMKAALTPLDSDTVVFWIRINSQHNPALLRALQNAGNPKVTLIEDYDPSPYLNKDGKSKRVTRPTIVGVRQSPGAVLRDEPYDLSKGGLYTVTLRGQPMWSDNEYRGHKIGTAYRCLTELTAIKEPLYYVPKSHLDKVTKTYKDKWTKIEDKALEYLNKVDWEAYHSSKSTTHASDNNFLNVMKIIGREVKLPVTKTLYTQHQVNRIDELATAAAFDIPDPISKKSDPAVVYIRQQMARFPMIKVISNSRQYGFHTDEILAMQHYVDTH